MAEDTKLKETAMEKFTMLAADDKMLALVFIMGFQSGKAAQTKEAG